MTRSLQDRHALVCGASQGIGAAVAHTLAERGATVTLLARNPQALARVRDALACEHGQRHGVLEVDHSDAPELLRQVSALVARKAVNILVNNSGGPPPGPAHSASPQDFVTAFEQHLVANQVLLQAVLEPMKASGYGRVVNVISTSVREPIPGLGVSNTIRGAVAGWAKTLSRELGPFGITVNNVLPGYTDTERLKHLFDNVAKKKGHSFEDEIISRLNEVPLGRFAEPREVAYAVAFLASPEAAYISGINLAVDGGRLRSA